MPKGVQFIEKRVVYGAPDLDKATTYAIERSNLTNRPWNARLHRRTLAYSKDVDRHRASVALAFVYRNPCHVARDRRISAAMAAGITDHLWSLEELVAVALAEPAGERPTMQPLTIPRPEGIARELPNGRGFLRVVGSPSSPTAPSPASTTPSAAPAQPAPVTAPLEPSADPSGQLDLLSWRPRARPLPPSGTQLELF